MRLKLRFHLDERAIVQQPRVELGSCGRPAGRSARSRARRCGACLRGWLQPSEAGPEATAKGGRRPWCAMSTELSAPPLTPKSRVSSNGLLLSQRSTHWQSEHCDDQIDDVFNDQMYQAIDFDLAHRKNRFTGFSELMASGHS